MPVSQYDTGKPVEDDIRTEDYEYNPAVEPKSAKAWLNLLQESEDAFEDWNTASIIMVIVFIL